MARRDNSGIIVSGHGTLNADVIAVGYRAQAKKVVQEAGEALDRRGLGELHQKLDALMQALHEHESRLGDPQAVFGLAERAAEELKREKPSKVTLRTFLSGIAEEAKSVAEIVAAAISLKDVAMLLLG